MEDISVILNVYKRPHTLDRQVEAVLAQSVEVLPENIHVWYNESGLRNPAPVNKSVKTYRSSWNTKFFGRFTLPLLCRTKYIAMFDDDNIPNGDWFKSCLEVINNPKTDGILGGTGVTIVSTSNGKIRGKRRMPIVKTGWNGDHLSETRRVDYVGQTWFFRKELAKYFWLKDPVSWDNGEDIMFSYMAQKYGGVNTFVPPHPSSNPDVWSTDFQTAWKEGRDKNASWRKKKHISTRESIFKECIANGWQTVNNL